MSEYEKQHTIEMKIRRMLALEAAIQAMRDAAIHCRALDGGVLTQDQKDIVRYCVDFGYADSNPVAPARTGDGLYWNFQKFLQP